MCGEIVGLYYIISIIYCIFIQSAQPLSNWGGEEEIDKLPNIGLKTVWTTPRYQIQWLRDTKLTKSIESPLRSGQWLRLIVVFIAIAKPCTSIINFLLNLEFVINILSSDRWARAVSDIRSWSFLTRWLDGWLKTILQMLSSGRQELCSKEAVLNSVRFKLR